MSKLKIVLLLIGSFLFSSQLLAQCQAEVGKNFDVCISQTTLNATAPISTAYQGLWIPLKGGGTIENPSMAQTKVSGLSRGENWFLWKITGDNCTATAGITITYDYAVATSQVICANQTTLNAEIPNLGTGTWRILSGGGAIVNPNLYNSTFNTINQGENKLIWKVSFTSCVSEATVTVLNNTVTVSKAGDNQILCTNSSQLTANIPQYGTGDWTTIKGNANFENLSYPNAKITQVGSGENVFRWSIRQSPCLSQSDVTITDNEISTSINPSKLEICTNTTSLTASNSSEFTGVWSVIQGNAQIVSPSNIQTSLNTIDLGVNAFQWKVFYSICTATASVEVTNHQISSFAGENFGVCQSRCQLNATQLTNGSGYWSVTKGLAVVEEPTLNSSIVRNLNQGENQFLWTTSWGICSASSSVTVSNNSFSSYIKEFTTPHCKESDGSITVDTKGGKSPFAYLWSDAKKQTTLTAQDLSTGTYKVTVTDSNTCTSSSEMEFIDTDSRLRSFSIQGEDTIFVDSEPVKYFSDAKIVDKYTWTVSSNGTITKEANDTIWVKWSKGGVGEVDLQIKNQCNEYGTNPFAVQIIATNQTPNQNILVPNGVDNKFIIREIEECTECFPNNELLIYDSTGLLIYQAISYQNNWNGIANTGSFKNNPLPSGTYYYLFRFDKSKKSTQKTGYVVIIR